MRNSSLASSISAKMKILAIVASAMAYACYFLAYADEIEDERAYPTPMRDSPLLPHLLKSLSRDKNAPKTATRWLDHYDYIIAGGGTAGSVLAGRLSEIPCVTVLLLEAVKLPPKLTEVPAAATAYLDTDIDWQYITDPQQYTGAGMVGKASKMSNGKALGGSSTINGMFAVRGNKNDFNSWKAKGCTGWSYEEVLPYFLKLENFTDPMYKDNGYHNTSGPVTIERSRYSPKLEKAFYEAAATSGYEFVDINGPSQIGFDIVRKTMRNAQRCSPVKAYLVPAENRPNLHIITNAMVAKVLIDGQRRATGVQFHFNGLAYKVGARKEVILSAGAVASPKLLMLSGIGHADELRKWNIDVVADLPVGDNFQNHVAVPLNFVLDENKVIPYDKRINDTTILQYINDRAGPLSISFGSTVLFYLKSPNSGTPENVPDYQVYLTELIADESLRKFFNLEHQVFKTIYGPYLNKAIFSCNSFAANPSSQGTLRLRSTCPYDKPIIDPRYFENEQDVEKTIAGLKVCLELGKKDSMREIGAEPFKTVYPGCNNYEVNSDDYLRCIVRTTSFSEFHYSGTVKMGRLGDPTAVLDPRLRVKTVRGLRVVDNSIMPSITSGNTMLPAIMIAEKAADMIKEDSYINCGF